MVQIFIMHSNFVKYQIFRKQNIYKSVDWRQFDNQGFNPRGFYFQLKKRIF